MSEISDSREVVNHEPESRSYKREDGTYVSFDLCEAKPGDIVTIGVGVRRNVELTKEEGKNYPSAMEDWTYSITQRALGAVVSHVVEGPTPVRLSLAEPTKVGMSFRVPSVVLREGLELKASEVESECPAILLHNLGVIADIRVAHAKKDSTTE